jgi:hypothetical protein
VSFGRPTRSCARRLPILRCGARPPVKDMIAFIDDHRAVYGIEPICNVLPIAPSTYQDYVATRASASRLSDTAKRDLGLKTQIERVFVFLRALFSNQSFCPYLAPDRKKKEAPVARTGALVRILGAEGGVATRTLHQRRC